MNRRALIVVDPQNDFMPGGALAVPGGDEIIPGINRLILGHTCATAGRKLWDWVVATRDWHPANHSSFKKQGGLWPAHCVQDMPGAKFHKDLVFASAHEDRTMEKLAVLGDVIRKGWDKDVDSYSAFFDNERKNETELDNILKQRGIDEIFVCGLATDYCVKFTVLDALDLRIPTTVIIDACRAVNAAPLDEKKALVEMARAGAKLAVIEDIFR